MELSPVFQRVIRKERLPLVEAFVLALNETAPGRRLVQKAEKLAAEFSRNGNSFSDNSAARLLLTYFNEHGKAADRNSGPVWGGNDRRTWEQIDIALLFGMRKMEGGSSLETINRELGILEGDETPSDEQKLYKKIAAVLGRYDFTFEVIEESANAYREQHPGKILPSARSGLILQPPLANGTRRWNTVAAAIPLMSFGRYISMPDFFAKRGLRKPPIETLSLELIREAMIETHKRTGYWPGPGDGKVEYGTLGNYRVMWSAINTAMKMKTHGLDDCPYDSMHQMYMEEGFKDPKELYRPEVSPKIQNVDERAVLSKIFGLYAAVLEQALDRAYPKDPFAGQEIKSPKNLPLSADDIADALRAHLEAEGTPPTKNSGRVRHGAIKGQIGWARINARMIEGSIDGIPAGTTLAQFKESLGIVSKADNTLVFLSRELVDLSIWLHLYQEKCAPHRTLGKVQYGPLKDKITWTGIDKAMAEGRVQGIPAGTSLATYKEILGIKPTAQKTKATKPLIEEAIMLHLQNTSTVPTKTSGAIRFGTLKDSITWGRVNALLTKGKIEGVVAGTTLAQYISVLIQNQALEHYSIYDELPAPDLDCPLPDYPDISWRMVGGAMTNVKGSRRATLDQIIEPLARQVGLSTTMEASPS